jgi:hypothetical protein
MSFPSVTPESPESSPDFVTVLECEPGKRCAKLYTDPSQVPDSYDAGMYFTCSERPVSNIDDLYELLNELRKDPTRMVIRGRLRDEFADHVAAGGTVRKKSKDELIPEDAREPGGPEVDRAPFETAQHHWTMFDIDATDIKFDASNPRASVAAWRATLSEGLRDAAMIVQFSAGQHRSETLKIHAWVWRSNEHGQLAFDDDALTSWAERKKFDPKLFQCVQNHYTSDPVFEGGDDPLTPRELIRLDGGEAWLDIEADDLKPRMKSSGRKEGGIDIDAIGEPSGAPEYVDAVATICALLAADIKANCQHTLSHVAGMAYKTGWPKCEALPLLRALAEHKYQGEDAEQRVDWAIQTYALAIPKDASGLKALGQLTRPETAQAVQDALESAKPAMKQAVASMNESRKRMHEEREQEREQKRAKDAEAAASRRVSGGFAFTPRAPASISINPSAKKRRRKKKPSGWIARTIARLEGTSK